MRRRPGGRRDGFSMVEALTTLALSALILASLAALLSVMMRVGDRAARAAEGQEQSARLFAMLERELGAMVPAQFAGAERLLAFEGDPDRVMFAIDAADTTGLRTTRLVVLQVDPANGALLRAEGPLTPGTGDIASVPMGPAQVVIAGGPPITFGYEGSGNTADGASWRGKRLPDAVVVQFAGGTIAQRIAVRAPIFPACAEPGNRACPLRPDEDEPPPEDPTDAEQ